MTSPQSRDRLEILLCPFPNCAGNRNLCIRQWSALFCFFSLETSLMKKDCPSQQFFRFMSVSDLQELRTHHSLKRIKTHHHHTLVHETIFPAESAISIQFYGPVVRTLSVTIWIRTTVLTTHSHDTQRTSFVMIVQMHETQSQATKILRCLTE